MQRGRGPGEQLRAQPGALPVGVDADQPDVADQLRAPVEPTPVELQEPAQHGDVRDRAAVDPGDQPQLGAAAGPALGARETRPRPGEAAPQQPGQRLVVGRDQVVLPVRGPGRAGLTHCGVHRAGCSGRSSRSGVTWTTIRRAQSGQNRGGSSSRRAAQSGCSAAAGRPHWSQNSLVTGGTVQSVSFSALIGICSSPSRSMSDSAGRPSVVR